MVFINIFTYGLYQQNSYKYILMRIEMMIAILILSIAYINLIACYVINN